VDAVLRCADAQVRKDDRPLRVQAAVGDPELLAEDGRRVDDPLVARHVQRGGGLHLNRVVAEAKLRQREAADVFEAVDAVQQARVVLLRTEAKHRSAKEVELHRHLGGHAAVAEAGHLVRCEDAEGVVGQKVAHCGMRGEYR
jgi:hypothetical protein